MKKILVFLLLYACSSSNSGSHEKEIAEIDSIVNYMDSAVFKFEKPMKESGIVGFYTQRINWPAFQDMSLGFIGCK